MLMTLLTVLISVCIAEMGDKTQLLVVGFAAKHKMTDIIVGVFGATILLNIMGVLLGSCLSKIIPMQFISLAAGFFFLIFALLTLKPGNEMMDTDSRSSSAIGIGLAFFLAELGDKTQLSAIAFAAERSNYVAAVFAGATLGMLLADGIGLAVGRLLHKNLPERMMQFTAFGIFTVFGFLTLLKCFRSFLPGRAAVPMIVIISVYVILALSMIGKRKHGVYMGG